MSADRTRDEENAQLKAKDKIDYLFKVINRFDFYINSTNTKASLIIAWNGVLIGTILLKYSEILSMFQPAGWAKVAAIVLLSLLGTCSLISNVFVLSVIFPFLKPSSKRATGRILQSESMLFFGAVAAMGAEDYHKRVVDSDAGEILADLADQAATIAQGLQDKMQLIRKSLVAVGLGLVCIFCLLILKAVTA
jgi:hypothetical protein